jgi:hypothetical protein
MHCLEEAANKYQKPKIKEASSDSNMKRAIQMNGSFILLTKL